MRRALVVLHRWFGLFSALFLFVAGLTGALIAWDHELDAWLNPELFRARTQGAALPALLLAEQLEAADPRLSVRYLELATTPGRTQLLSVQPRIDPATGRPFALDFDQVALDPASGEVQGRRLWGALSLSRQNLLPFLYKLHYSLHLPEAADMQPGVLFMGAVAVVWLLDAFIALCISFPGWSTWRRSFAFRWRAGGARLLFDLHRSGGVWLWPLLCVFALSAVAMNLGPQLLRPLVATLSELSPDPLAQRAARPNAAREPRLSLTQIAQRARAEAQRRNLRAPLGGLFYAPESAAYGAGFFAPGKGHADLSLGNPWLYFDAQSGALLGAQLPGAGSAGDVFMQLQFPLHSGRIGGVAGRVLVTLLGLGVALLSATGVVLWARKRRARWRAAARRTPALAALGLASRLNPPPS
jgi:uncharacterized iron-regulated membrane protein